MRILAADIGATHARFGLFEGDDLLDSLWLPSGAFSFSGLLCELARQKPHMATAAAERVAFALPGPVNGRRGKPSHLPYTIDLDELGLDNALLLNDFEAQSWAALGPLRQNMRVLAQAAHPPAARPVLAVVGPGSGLGMGFALPGQGLVFPSEGGHMALPLTGKEELAFSEFAGKRVKPGNDPLRADSVLCGPGLELIHTFFTGEQLKAADIAALPGFASSATARLFSTLLGRVCRSFALTLLPHTLVLTGGVAAKNPHLIENEHFLHALGLGVHPLPALELLLGSDPLSGLWGAAEAAKAHG